MAPQNSKKISKNRFKQLLDLKNKQLEAIKKMFILMTEVNDADILIRDMLTITRETLYANGDLTFFAQIEDKSLAVPAFNKNILSDIFGYLQDTYDFSEKSLLVNMEDGNKDMLTELSEAYSTMLFTPIHHDSKSFGFLAIYSIETIALSEDEEIFLQYVSQAIGSYICNKWFEQQNDDTLQLQQRLEELNAIYSVSEAFAFKSSMDINSMLSQALDAILSQDAFNIEEKGAIFLINEKEEMLELVCQKNISETENESSASIPLGQGLCGSAAQSGEVIISDHCEGDESCPFCCSDNKNHGHMIIPLKASKDLLGVLCLYLQPNTTASSQQKEILIAVTNQLAISLENAKLYAFAKYNSFHDHLTGLGNRNLLETRLNEDLSRAQRYGNYFSLAMIDVDHFKKLNDRYGHVAGDLFLKELANILKDTARNSDIVARYGGEEFTILMPNTSGEKAEIFLNRLRKIVAKHRFAIEGQDKFVNFTISIGITGTQEGVEETAKSVLRRADKALYEAKERGRNCVIHHNNSDNTETN